MEKIRLPRHTHEFKNGVCTFKTETKKCGLTESDHKINMKARADFFNYLNGVKN